MKVYFVSEDFPEFGMEYVYAFSNRYDAENFVEKKNHPKHKRKDDPKYGVIEMELEKDFLDRVYLVYSLVEGYDYDGQLIYSNETILAVFADVKSARCFLFEVFEQNPEESNFLGLKEFIGVDKTCSEKASAVIFKCNYMPNNRTKTQ